MFPDENPAGGVPEADAAINGGADADVALAWMLTEGEAWHQVPVAHQLTWSWCHQTLQCFVQDYFSNWTKST